MYPYQISTKYNRLWDHSAFIKDFSRRRIMLNMEMKRCLAFLVVTAITFFNILIPLPAVQAADHAESTSVAGDPGADIGDVYAYLDPKDNTKVILAIDVEGFVVPSEGLNLSFFGPDILYRFEIENTGDSIADTYLDITFSPQTSRSAAQTATISLPAAPGARTRRFEAPTTVQTFNPEPNPFTVT